MKHRVWLAIVGVIGLLLLGGAAGCSWWHHEEHPTGEHPTEEHPTEQPAEHPTEHPAEHPHSAAPAGAVFAKVAVERPATLLAAEHPAEHPVEHPKPPARPKPVLVPLTKETIAASIKGYVDWDTDLKGGYFLIYDKENEEVLMLTLDKVHKDRLSKTGPTIAFACCDFKTPDGKLYDLDFWMRQAPEGLKVTEVMVHKEAGEPRYNWKQEEGIWKRVPVEG
jgi:hypothetical protein